MILQIVVPKKYPPAIQPLKSKEVLILEMAVGKQPEFVTQGNYLPEVEEL